MQHPLFANRRGRFDGRFFFLQALAVLLTSTILFNARATNHILRQDEIMVGFNGNPAVQFVKITVSDGTQKSWGPGPGAGDSRQSANYGDTVR